MEVSAAFFSTDSLPMFSCVLSMISRSEETVSMWHASFAMKISGFPKLACPNVDFRSGRQYLRLSQSSRPLQSSRISLSTALRSGRSKAMVGSFSHNVAALRHDTFTIFFAQFILRRSLPTWPSPDPDKPFWSSSDVHSCKMSLVL